MYDGFELGVQAWDKLDEFMSIVISTGDICIEGCLDVGNAEEKGFNGGCIFILLFFFIQGRAAAVMMRSIMY